MATFEVPKDPLPAPSLLLRIPSSQLEQMLETLPLDFEAERYTVVLSGPTTPEGVVIGMHIDLYPGAHTSKCSINQRASTIARISKISYDPSGILSFCYLAPWHGYRITVHRDSR
jgi:hypothetical protein